MVFKNLFPNKDIAPKTRLERAALASQKTRQNIERIREQIRLTFESASDCRDSLNWDNSETEMYLLRAKILKEKLQKNLKILESIERPYYDNPEFQRLLEQSSTVPESQSEQVAEEDEINDNLMEASELFASDPERQLREAKKDLTKEWAELEVFEEKHGFIAELDSEFATWESSDKKDKKNTLPP